MMTYKTYKESGVDWIGEIPEHWMNVRLKLISDITKGRKPKKDYDEYGDGLMPYMSMEFLRSKTSSPIYADTSEKNLVLVEEGDILILWDGSKAGEIVRAKKGVLSSTMAKIQINDERFDRDYLNFLLQLGQEHIQNNTVGMGIPHVSGNILKDLMMLLPSIDEQTQIAAYLDHKTQIIDALIEKKEQLIKKLQAQRQAIINEAVTKGLNENTKMKDTGIEWLGEIPEHWEVLKLNYLTSKIGDGLHSTPKYKDDEKFFFINGNNLNDGKIEISNNTRTVDKIEFKRLWKDINETTLLLSINGTIGNVALYNNEPVILGKSACFVNCENRLSREFLMRLLQSTFYQNYFMNEVTGTTIYNLSLETIRNTKIVLPNIAAQKEIISYLKVHLIKFDEVIDKSKNQIKKLKSYRQSIISEAVTGKIDVRDWEPKNTIPNG